MSAAPPVDTAQTYGWDTVFAIHIADANAAIATAKTSPPNWRQVDAADGYTVSGDFGNWAIVPGGRASFDAVDVRLRRTDRDDPATNDDALAELRITVMDRDQAKVGRAFSSKVIELVLANYPGLFTTSPPSDASSFGVYWPALVPASFPHHAAVIQVINVPRVLRAAERAGATVEFTVGPGDEIAEGAALAVVTGPREPALEPEVLKAVTVGVERTFEQDPALALRLLADIALRALSPAVNDPTTAVQALDRIASLLRVLATRDLDIDNIADGSGTTRVKLVLPTWEQYLAVALDAIIALPGLLPTVTRRLTRLLDDIAALAPPGRRPGLDKRRTQIALPA